MPHRNLITLTAPQTQWLVLWWFPPIPLPGSLPVLTDTFRSLCPWGFSRQEHWSGLPFPSPMHESEKWKGSRSVVFNSLRPHGPQPTRLLHPWDFPGKRTKVGCHCLLHIKTGWIPFKHRQENCFVMIVQNVSLAPDWKKGSKIQFLRPCTLPDGSESFLLFYTVYGVWLGRGPVSIHTLHSEQAGEDGILIELLCTI